MKAPSPKGKKKKKAGNVKKKKKKDVKSTIHLLEHKRAHNVEIILARIKISTEDLTRGITCMDREMLGPASELFMASACLRDQIRYVGPGPLGR